MQHNTYIYILIMAAVSLCGNIIAAIVDISTVSTIVFVPSDISFTNGI